LGSAVDGFQTFAAAGVSNGETVRYCIEDGTTNFELGSGVFTASGTTLTRVVSESSNSNNAINLSGSAIVFITAIAADLQPTTFTTTVFTATANQTAFSVSYTVGFVEVFLNGSKLSAADFTATNGSSIVLASGATVGDTLDVVAYGTQTIANVYTQSQSDARFLQLTGGTLSGDLSGTTSTFSGDVTIADKIVHSGDTNTAIRFPAVDTFSVETDGSERMRVSATGLQATGDVIIPDKIVHDGDTDTAIRFSAADTVTIETGGAERLKIDSSGLEAAGDVIVPDKIVHTGDTNTAIRFPAADTVSFETSGSERFRVASAGQLGVGGTNYGTSGQILTSGGSGAAPSWADAAGGGGQFDAVASGTIANGALVSLNSDGSVSPTSGFAGAESVFADGTTTYCDAVFDSNSNKSVIFYKFSGAVKARVATTSGTSISYGTEATASSNSDGIIRTAFDSNSNKIVVFFKNSTGGKGSAVVGTISGTNISFGSVVDVTSYAIQDPKIAFDSNSNKIVVAFKEDNPNRGKALVGTVSGTSISFGSEVTFQSNNCYPQDMVFDTNSNKIVLIIKDDSDDDDGQALVGTVSGTSISFGTKVKFTTGNGEKARMAFDSNSNKVVIVFRDTTNSSYLSSVVGTVSGTSISFGSTAVVSQVTVSGVNIGVSFDSNINKTIVAFPNGSNSNKGTMAVGTVSGTSISFSPLAIFNPASTEHIASTFDSSANKFIIVYSDEGNGDDGTAIAADGLGIDNFSKWIGFASAAISNSATGTINVLGGINEGQSSLEVGSTYYLTDAAALSTTLVSGREVGKALSATKLLITQGSITQ